MLGKLNTISFTFNSSQAKEPNRNSNILKIIIIHNGLIGCEYSVHIKNSQYLQEFYFIATLNICHKVTKVLIYSPLTYLTLCSARLFVSN